MDSLYVRQFDLTDPTIIKSRCNRLSSIDIETLPRISERILPRIHHHIHQLTVEQSSIKSLLRVDYPYVDSLSLVNFEEQILSEYLTDDLILRDLIKQIINLQIDLREPAELLLRTVGKIFSLVISLCPQLTDLNFCYMFTVEQYETCIYSVPRETTLSSSLTKLKINVANFIGCVYLLDGRFECLSTFIVKVGDIFDVALDIRGGPALPKLKCFSLITFTLTCEYDNLVVPLLRRMSNLEELQLYLPVGKNESTYIDGIQLWDQFLVCMTKMKKLTFNIDTVLCHQSDGAYRPSNEDVQRSFHGRNYPPVASCVKTGSDLFYHQCRIYSLPYDFEYYCDLNH